MARYDAAVVNGTVVIPYLGALRCDIGIRGGGIAALTQAISPSQGERGGGGRGPHYRNRAGPSGEFFPGARAAPGGQAGPDYAYHIAVMTADQLDEVDW